MKGIMKLLSLSMAIFVVGNSVASSHSNTASSGLRAQTAVFAQSRPATGKIVFIFDPKYTSWALYNRQGQLMRTGRASGGQNYCPDVKRACRTISGTFTAFREEGPGCKSAKFPLGKGGSPMPNCMYFHKGFAIHGSYHVPNYNASHGCIRVSPADAAWLNAQINPGATVIVRPYR